MELHFTCPNKVLASVDSQLECKTRLIPIKLGEMEPIFNGGLQSLNYERKWLQLVFFIRAFIYLWAAFGDVETPSATKCQFGFVGYSILIFNLFNLIFKWHKQNNDDVYFN